MPIVSAVGHADSQAIIDGIGQPLLDTFGQVIYEFDGLGGVGWATAVGLAISTPSGITVSTFDGTKLYIGGTDDFSANPNGAPWIEVGNISHLGDYGGTYFGKFAQETVGDQYTRQVKDLAFAPVMELKLNRDDTDLGQRDMRVASYADEDDYYNFKIEEASGGAVFARTIFRGQVFGFATVRSGVNDIKSINTSIEVNPDTIINTVL